MMTTATKRIKSFTTAIITFISICSILLCYTAFAASVTFNVSVPSTSVGIGDTVEVTVEIAANGQSISSYSYEIHYDPTLLKPVTVGDQSADQEETSEGIISYSGTGSSMTATFKFTTLASGTASLETSATEVLSSDGEAIDMTPAYNSINISEAATTETSASTEASLSADQPDEPAMVNEEDEVGTLTETESIPDNTLVSMHSSGNTYYIISKPDSVAVPSAYLPVKIKLNDTDIKAYMKGTDGNTVLLYAANSDGHKGWYYFNTQEGTFLDATDLLGGTSTDSISNFISQNKFIIMLIAIIVLVVLVVVIIILAVSLKGMITDYETQIDRLKKDIDKNSKGDKNAKNSNEKKGPVKTSDENANKDHEHIRLNTHNNDMPTINNKALFPEDDTHESYADSDYDNQVSPDEDDYIHTDDYDDSAFDDMADSAFAVVDDDSTEVQNDNKASDEKTADAKASSEDTSKNAASDNADAEAEKKRKIQASLDEIDAVLESAKKYKN